MKRAGPRKGSGSFSRRDRPLLSRAAMLHPGGGSGTSSRMPGGQGVGKVRPAEGRKTGLLPPDVESPFPAPPSGKRGQSAESRRVPGDLVMKGSPVRIRAPAWLRQAVQDPVIFLVMPAMHDTNPTWRAATRAWYTVPEVGDVGTDQLPSVELTSLPIETNDEDSRRWSVTFRFATHLAADDDTVP